MDSWNFCQKKADLLVARFKSGGTTCLLRRSEQIHKNKIPTPEYHDATTNLPLNVEKCYKLLFMLEFTTAKEIYSVYLALKVKLFHELVIFCQAASFNLEPRRKVSNEVFALSISKNVCQTDSGLMHLKKVCEMLNPQSIQYQILVKKYI